MPGLSTTTAGPVSARSPSVLTAVIRTRDRSGTATSTDGSGTDGEGRGVRSVRRETSVPGRTGPLGQDTTVPSPCSGGRQVNATRSPPPTSRAARSST